jgi:hypothetical protein
MTRRWFTILWSLSLLAIIPRAGTSQSLCADAPLWGADSVDCALPDFRYPQNIVYARLYRTLYNDVSQPTLVQQIVTTSGATFCFPVDTTLDASYWVTTVNVMGKESCRSQGITLGVPNVGVDGVGIEAGPPEYYDLIGRKLKSPPTAPGVYFVRRGKATPKRLIVLWVGR